MPKHRVHSYFNYLLFGKPYSKVDKAIDRPYAVLGRKHRVMFHNPWEAFFMGSTATLDPKRGLPVFATYGWTRKRALKNQMEK